MYVFLLCFAYLLVQDKTSWKICTIGILMVLLLVCQSMEIMRVPVAALKVPVYMSVCPNFLYSSIIYTHTLVYDYVEPTPRHPP